jgi:hypothetical protein
LVKSVGNTFMETYARDGPAGGNFLRALAAPDDGAPPGKIVVYNPVWDFLDADGRGGLGDEDPAEAGDF